MNHNHTTSRRRHHAGRPMPEAFCPLTGEVLPGFDDDDDEWICEFLGTGKWLANLGRTRTSAPSRRHRRPLW